ncbi:hypothetical protein Psfp_04064 [Pelotomaculum sp. FP]|nr:hypothetical protein Psfp_04064 [Pelotomaculum sp. FP]
MYIFYECINNFAWRVYPRLLLLTHNYTPSLQQYTLLLSSCSSLIP